MIENIYERTKVLSKTSLKIALVLPKDVLISIEASKHLITHSSNLAIKSKGLMVTQNPDFFLQNLNDARASVDGCYYWLELIKDEGWVNGDILNPVLKECTAVSNLFGAAIKKIKPNG
jgi:hypothetical protein